MRWRPGQSVTAFFLPVISLYRSYQMMKNLHEVSDPRDLVEVPRFELRSPSGYRDNALVSVSPPHPGAWTRHAPIGAWWTLMLVSYVSGRAASKLVTPAVIPIQLALVAALCLTAVLVVRSIDSLQRERARRIDALAQQAERNDQLDIQIPL